MEHYRRQMTLSASPAVVYQALATQQGVRNWWTRTCEVAEVVGGRAEFRFDTCWKVMRIAQLLPQQQVVWQCIDANLDVAGLTTTNEWVGTRIVFRLAPAEGGKTRLEFEHQGLTPDLQCFGICQDGWNLFLGSLQAYVDTGSGQPFGAAAATDAATEPMAHA